MAEIDLQQQMVEAAKERSDIAKALLAIQSTLDKLDPTVARMESVLSSRKPPVNARSAGRPGAEEAVEKLQSDIGDVWAQLSKIAHNTAPASSDKPQVAPKADLTEAMSRVTETPLVVEEVPQLTTAQADALPVPVLPLFFVLELEPPTPTRCSIKCSDDDDNKVRTVVAPGASPSTAAPLSNIHRSLLLFGDHQANDPPKPPWSSLVEEQLTLATFANVALARVVPSEGIPIGADSSVAAKFATFAAPSNELPGGYLICFEDTRLRLTLMKLSQVCAVLLCSLSMEVFASQPCPPHPQVELCDREAGQLPWPPPQTCTVFLLLGDDSIMPLIELKPWPDPQQSQSSGNAKLQGTMLLMDTSVHWQFLRKEEFEGSGNYSSDVMTIPQSAEGILGSELMCSNQVSQFRPAMLVGQPWSAYCLLSSIRGFWQQEIAHPCYMIWLGSTANSRSCASFPGNKYIVAVNLSAHPVGELVCSVHKRRVQSTAPESKEFKNNIWLCFGTPLVESNLTGNKLLLFRTKFGRDLRLLRPEHPWPLPVLAMSSHQLPCDMKSVTDHVNIVKNSLRLIQVVDPLLGSKSYSGRHLEQLWDPGGNTSSVWPFSPLEEIAIYQIMIGGRNSVDGIELPSSCEPTPFQGGRHLMVPAFVDHHYYLNAFLKKIHFVHAYYQIQVCTGHGHHLDFVQAHLSYYYYPEGYHCDLGGTRKHPAPWDPGGRSPMSAWGQAEFQGGRNVMGISPASTSGEARPAHKAQAGSSDLV